MKLFKLLTITLLLVLINQDSAKEYYFQLTDLKESIVYKYECKDEPSETQYWKLTAINNTLLTEAFNHQLEKFEFFVEKYTDSGAEVIKFLSYHKDKAGNIDVLDRVIKTSDVYKWASKENYGYSTEYIHKDYGQILFSVDKTFIKKTTVSILGTNHEALKFKCIYRTQIPEEKYDYAYTQYMYYAKNIGLVKIEKEFDDGNSTTLELTEIIYKNEWDTMEK